MGEELKFGTLGDTSSQVVAYDEEARAMALLRVVGEETNSVKGKTIFKCMPNSSLILRVMLATFSPSAATVIERRVAQMNVDPVEFEEKVKRYSQMFTVDSATE